MRSSPAVSNLLELVGGTPLLPLRVLPGADCAEIWVKCEQYNPGGSVKDRIALAMIESAEARGLIRRGESVIVEPTSGNTGIGLALVCSVKGYPLVLTMPESMSLERRSLLEAYGAKLVLTPAEDSMVGAVQAAEELCRKNPNYFMPQQFDNPANPDVHRRTTGPEIVKQLGERRCAAFVAAVGTGGTVSGVGSLLKQTYPGVRVIAVEPSGSAVLSGGANGPHKIQGIGAGFTPCNFDRSVVDEIMTVADRDAYETKVALARKEGLLVGISSGANAFAAIKIGRALGPGHIVVTVMCDTGERYFSLDEYFA